MNSTKLRLRSKVSLLPQIRTLQNMHPDELFCVVIVTELQRKLQSKGEACYQRKPRGSDYGSEHSSSTPDS